MTELKQHAPSRNPKSTPRRRTLRHAAQQQTPPCPEYGLHEPEPDVWPYVAQAAIVYARLRAYAMRRPTLPSRLSGLVTVPMKKLLVQSGIRRRRQDQLECLLRRILGLCIRSRSYGYFYLDAMLSLILAEESRRPDGYTRRQLRDAFTLLASSGLIVFQIDALHRGGLYRVAFYDTANLAKQEWHVANFAKTLKKNLMITHRCPKLRSHSYRAKALGIEANKEKAWAQARIEKLKAQDRERRRLAEAKRRVKARQAEKTTQLRPATPKSRSRPILVLTQAPTPVSIPKLVTATLQATGRKVRQGDRSGGALGHYRNKLVAMGLTRAVQEYDRIQAARDLR